MKIQDLLKYGIEPTIISAWENAGMKYLLPVQRDAIRRYGLFDGKSLIVSAPTTSGKTFIGEMAAAFCASRKQKVIYLVPLKSVAEEKFRDFSSKYKDKTKIVISTRDRREYDEQIETGDYNIAILIYEKLEHFIVSNPNIVSQVSLIIIDEIQSISDEQRGAKLELLLTKLKLLDTNFQLLGLSAVLKGSEIIPEWLTAKFLQITERPVELRQGIIYNGLFSYETYNQGTEGTEPAFETTHHASDRELFIKNIIFFTGEEKDASQTLCFVKDKNSTQRFAFEIAEQVNFKPADDAISKLSTLEDSLSRRKLTQCLKKGVGFHNADLTLDERTVIESAFKHGQIKILISTTTLSMGINLPAKNVFIEPEKWVSGKGVKPCTVPITKSEFEN